MTEMEYWEEYDAIKARRERIARKSAKKIRRPVVW